VRTDPREVRSGSAKRGDKRRGVAERLALASPQEPWTPETLAERGTLDASVEGMSRHGVGMVFLLVLTVAAFALSLMFGYPVAAFALLLVGFVVAFVMATAWMRPPSYPPEHHPKIDRIFKDTAP